MTLFCSATLPVSVAAAALVCACGVILRLVNSVQPLPYMDEVFHVPQAQSYCRRNYTHWDPMITTPPGLYLSSMLWVEPVARLLSLKTHEICTATNLRAQNVVGTAVNFLLLHRLHRKIHGPSSHSLLTAFNLVSFPPLFFFTFLYYTDVWATTLVLASYALSLNHRHIMAALALLAALSFRQTSVVWVAFIAGNATIVAMETYFDPSNKREKKSLLSFFLSCTLSTPPSSLLLLLHSLLSLLWPYVLVCLTFATFVIWNGSVAMGDKKHHQVSLHLPQILYLFGSSSFFCSPYLLGEVWLFIRAGESLKEEEEGKRRRRKDLQWMAITCAGFIGFGLFAVQYFTYTHPYLLADNRHYTFYIWKNIFRRHDAVKYILVPLYSISALLFVRALCRSQTDAWVLLFLSCSFLSLIPQHLLELRYFILPHLLLRLHLPSSLPLTPLLSLLLEALLLVSVNGVSLYLFMFSPFQWPHSEEAQRFMW